MKIKVRELGSPHDWRAHQGFDSLISDSIDLLVQNERERERERYRVNNGAVYQAVDAACGCVLSRECSQSRQENERERERERAGIE